MRGGNPRSYAAWFYGLAAGTAAIDQITKAAARSLLSEDRPVRLIPGFLDLRLSYNSGAAFGLMPNWAPLFIIVALVAIFAIVKLRQTGPGSRVLSMGLGLLMGGAIGNLIDRLSAPSRGVTDFISVHASIDQKQYAWPTFNVADIGIVAGALLVFVAVYILEKRRAEAT